MSVSDILGYNNTRNLSKGILLIMAVAVSTFAFGGAISRWLDYEFFILIRNYIAILGIVMIFLVKEDAPTPYLIHYYNTQVTKWINYVLFGIITLDISSISFFLSGLLSYPIFGYSLITARNIIAVVLMLYAKLIHDSG